MSKSALSNDVDQAVRPDCACVVAASLQNMNLKYALRVLALYVTTAISVESVSPCPGNCPSKQSEGCFIRKHPLIWHIVGCICKMV
jgi:hypothetical protein